MPKFPMPTAENGFQILNLHPKKHRIKKKNFFGGSIFGKILPTNVFKKYCIFFYNSHFSQKLHISVKYALHEYT